MSKSARIDLVIRLANRKEQEAARLLQSWARQVQEAEAQVVQLQDYQQGYLEQARQPALVLSQLVALRQFIGQLGQVIEDQQARLQPLREQHARYQAQWLQLHRRRKLLEDYGDRLTAEAVRALDRRWDRLCDELTNRRSTPAPE